MIKGVEMQFEMFQEGFESIMPMSSLKQFYPEEVNKISFHIRFFSYMKSYF